MPTVPRKTTPDVQVAPQARQFQNISAPSAAFGTLQAQNTINTGRQLASTAADIQQFQQQLQAREDETRLLEYETKLTEYETKTLYTGDNPLLNTQGNQAFGSTKNSLEGFDKFTQEIDKDLTSERQKIAAQRLKARMRTGLARTVSRHESSQRRVWEKSVRQASIESSKDKAVLNYTDDVVRTAALARMAQAIRLDMEGMPQEAIDQRIEAEQTRVHGSIIDRYATKDLASAEAYYEEHKDTMDPDSYGPIEKSFDVIRKQNQAVVRSEIQNQIRTIEDTYKMGIDVPKSQVSAVREAAVNNGLDTQAEQLTQIESVFDSNKEFLNTPLPDQPAKLLELRQSIEQKTTPEKIAKYSLMQASMQEKIKQLNTDPISYYEQRKDIRSYSPVDYSDPQRFRYEMDQRRISVADLQRKEGIRLPLLKKQEIDQIAKSYSQSSAEAKTAMLNNIRASMNPDEARDLAKRIAPQQKNMAAVMAIVHDAPEVAAQIASGSTRDKMVPRTQVSAELQTYLEGAVQDGVALEAITESVHDLYTEQAFQNNDASNVLDVDRLKDAAEQIIGPKMSVKTSIIGSASQVLPFRLPSGEFITENQFEGALKSLDAETLMQAQGDVFRTVEGKELDVQETIGRTKLVTVGDGKYELHTRSGQQIVGTDPSRPFVLDMKSVTTSDNIKGFFETATDSLSKNKLDKYVEAQRNLSTLVETNAPQEQIDDARASIEKLRDRAALEGFVAGRGGIFR